MLKCALNVRCMRSEELPSDQPRGTTERVYQFIYRSSHPVKVREIQEGLGMASASTAHYHTEKLLAAGLIRQEEEGYVVDRILLDNYVKILQTSIPIQATLAAFFATSLIVLLTIARPSSLDGAYLFSIFVNLVALVSAATLCIRDYHRKI
jgi:DNA-binding transcriptional ArsR family regulator